MRKIDVSKYSVKIMTDSGLMAILMELGDARPVEMVELVGLDNTGHNFFNYYNGGSINHVEEAALLSDGRIYLVVSTSNFEGTFSSGSTRVGHYLLTK